MERQVFARKASGLVRSLSPTDSFVWSISSIGLSYVTTTLVWMLSWKPAADVLAATIVTALLSAGVVLSFSFFMSAMPRSGADYIYVSRTIHPLFGWVGSWFWTVANFFWCGWCSYFLVTYGLPLLFACVGIATRNVGLLNLATTVTSPPWATILPLLVVWPYLWGVGFLTVFIPVRRMLLFSRITLIICALGTIIALGILAATPQSVFVASYDAMVHDLYPSAGGYQSVIDAARAAGIDTNPPINWADTFSLIPIVGAAVMWATGSAFLGGELKEIRKSSFLAPLGGLAVTSLLLIGSYYASVSAAGRDFVLAITYLSSNNPAALPFVVPSPQIYLLASVLTNNAVLAALMGFSFTAMLIGVAPNNVYPALRYLFAYSMDRMAPEWMTTVNRYRTPKYTPIIALGGGTIFLFLFVAFPNIILGFTFLTGAWPWLLVSIAAMVFPFVKKDVFEASPGKWRIGGLPVMTLAGAVGTVFVAALVALYAWDPGYGGGGIWAWVFNAIVVVLTVAGFFIIRAIRKRQGIDISLAFREIPPV